MRYIILIILIVIGIVISFALQKRKPDPPTSPSYRAPTQLDPQDFDLSGTDYFFILFSSDKCDSCSGVWSYLSELNIDNLSSKNIDIEKNVDLASKYKIDGVPTTLLVNKTGEVQANFFGPINNESISELLESMK